jgi:hypothetical protein
MAGIPENFAGSLSYKGSGAYLADGDREWLLAIDRPPLGALGEEDFAAARSFLFDSLHLPPGTPLNVLGFGVTVVGRPVVLVVRFL